MKNRSTKLWLLGLAACWTVCLLASAVSGQVRTGNFQIELIGPENVSYNPALNDGYQSTWFKYPIPPQSPPPPPWWNEWWYNDPYIRPGGKWVEVRFDYALLIPDLPGDVVVTINWTNGLWVGQSTPPTWQTPGIDDPERYIERMTPIAVFHLDPMSQPGHFDSGRFWLPIDYNPEWVSVDVQGMGNVGISNGVIFHECVPEPASALLIALGGVYLWKRKPQA